MTALRGYDASDGPIAKNRSRARRIEWESGVFVGGRPGE